MCEASGGGSVGVDPEGAHPPNFAQSKFWLWSTLNHSRWRRSGLAQFTREPQTAKRFSMYVCMYIYPDRQKILTQGNFASHQNCAYGAKKHTYMIYKHSKDRRVMILLIKEIPVGSRPHSLCTHSVVISKKKLCETNSACAELSWNQ